MKALILVVEDCVVTSLATSRVIEQALPHCRIMRAQSCFEAELLLSVYEFRLVVVDVHLPDGNGLDLLPNMVERNPGTNIIVLTADPLPEYRDRSLAFGVQHFLPKPFCAMTLAEVVRDCVPATEDNEVRSQFTACLRGLSVLDVIQLKCIAGGTARLEVSNRSGSSSVISIENGQIVHVEVRDERRTVVREGLEALVEILRWHGGTVEDVLPRLTVRRTITGSWESLLLEAAQQSDEQAEFAVPA